MDSFKVFSRANFVARDVELIESDHFAGFKRPTFTTKNAYRDWCSDPKTAHSFFSLIEGINPHLRVTRRNMPKQIHGLVADFDSSDIPLEDIESSLERISSRFKPTAWSRSFSGGVHMIWVFEKPILFNDKKVWESFLDGFNAEVGLKFVLPGFDEPAFKSYSQYYEIGHDWVFLDHRIEETKVVSLMAAAINATKYVAPDTSELSWEVINSKVAELFPEVGELSDGQRTNRFWDDSADAEAVIVTAAGCHCFTGGQAFVPWEQILGREFVEEVFEDMAAAAVASVYKVDQAYFVKDGKDVWRPVSSQVLETYLACEFGLSTRSHRGAPSESKQALNMVRRDRTLDGVTEALYRREEIVEEGGLRLLNLGRVRVLEPVGEPVKWGTSFPWISDYLEKLFGEEQLPYFIAWLAHFYTSARNFNLQNGLAVAIAGPPSSGKTFLSTCLTSKLMGGSEEASAFLTSKDKFNDSLFKFPLLTVDDAVAASDPKASEVYTQMLKKITANQSISIRAMHRSPVSITWKGRIIVTMNEDVESLQMLPLTEYSLLDKISFFKVSSPGIDPRTNWHKHMMPELAYFAQYLADYEIPEELRGEKRFGVKPYHHNELLKSASEAGPAAEIEDLIQEWRTWYFGRSSTSLEPQDNEWVGGAAALMKSLKEGNFDFRGTNRSLGRGMSRLSAQDNCNWITRLTESHRGNSYRIISQRWANDIPETVKGPF